MRYLFCYTCLCFAIVSCTNNTEIGKAKDVNTESIYYDYKIWGKEDSEEATVMLQYRFGGENGTTLVLEEPSKVALDGVELKTDSAKLTGAFYEATKPIKELTGKHTIIFTDKENKEHKEEFNFVPFTLAAELPERVKKQPFTIKLNDVELSATTIRLVITDTVFASADVNEEMLIEKGEIRIDRKILNALEAGPVTLEIYKEEERRLKTGSKEGGRIQLTYSLKRQFELVN